MSGRASGEIPPRARDLVNAVAATPTSSVKALVVGGIGTGKTATLAALRTTLRSAGVEVRAHPPRTEAQSGGAMVIDDAHLLTDDELDALTAMVADPAVTLVASTEPCQHRPALRALTVAMERENPAVVLGALRPSELQRAVDAGHDGPASPEVVRALTAATAGLPFLIAPALRALHTGDPSPAAAMAQAARFALIERLRGVDEPVLDALLIGSLSPDLGATDVAAALRVTPEEAQTLVDRARSSGLIEPSHSAPFLHSVHRAVAQVVGAARHHDIETSLLATQLELETLSTDLALRLGEHGLRDDRLAATLQAQADQMVEQPLRAARLYKAAVDAGATRLNARLADALAVTGDCAAAGRLADSLLTSEEPDERAAAVRIAASIAVHDGNAAQGAELFHWLGPHPEAFVSAAGAVLLLGSGDPEAARAALQAVGSGPPTSATRSARSLAEGLLLTLDQPYDVAIARLGQSLSGQVPPCAVPDTPAALVTLTALHGGDSVRARSVISRAGRMGGDGAFTHRHTLLSAWVKMLDGQLASASAEVAALNDADLHRRDALWAAALRTGLARRGGDTGGMQKHWYAGVEVLSEYSVDLFSLLPLGELWIAAARLRQTERLRHALEEAFALLDRLGRPVLWSVPLHWSGVHAGILANSPEAVAPHGQALTAAAAKHPFAKALAGAGRIWLRVLASEVDTAEVTAAVRGLAAFGHTWDATRLASQAALQTPDPRVSGAMLQLARDLKATVAVDDDAAGDPGAATPKAPAPLAHASPAARLSEREREVANLLLLGMPYRDIGAQLFISAKTVEHHVARIRRRLGAESRSELLTMLRAMLAPQG